MNSLPDHLLIRYSNQSINRVWRFGQGKIDTSGDELDSRFPYFPLEYDATGQIITSEVMGYTEEGEEIWS